MTPLDHAPMTMPLDLTPPPLAALDESVSWWADLHAAFALPALSPALEAEAEALGREAAASYPVDTRDTVWRRRAKHLARIARAMRPLPGEPRTARFLAAVVSVRALEWHDLLCRAARRREREVERAGPAASFETEGMPPRMRLTMQSKAKPSGRGVGRKHRKKRKQSVADRHRPADTGARAFRR